MTTLPDIKPLIARLGGPVSVANAVGLTHSAVCQWHLIPDRYLVALEKHALSRGEPVLREEMRPDLYYRGGNSTVVEVD